MTGKIEFMKTYYEELTDENLARLFFWRLQQSYSASGINLGRSLRGGLLEGYIHLIHPASVVNPDKYFENELVEEARRRTGFAGHPRVLAGNWELMSTEDLAYRCLGGLKFWYKVDEATNASSLVLQKRRVDAICALLPLPHLPDSTTMEELTRFAIEAHYRYSDLLQAEIEADRLKK